jgi:hypothetical protein
MVCIFNAFSLVSRGCLVCVGSFHISTFSQSSRFHLTTLFAFSHFHFLQALQCRHRLRASLLCVAQGNFILAKYWLLEELTAVPHSPLVSAAEPSTPRCVGPSPSPSGCSPAIAAPDTTILLRSFGKIDAGESFVSENRGNKMPREQWEDHKRQEGL